MTCISQGTFLPPGLRGCIPSIPASIDLATCFKCGVVAGSCTGRVRYYDDSGNDLKGEAVTFCCNSGAHRNSSWFACITCGYKQQGHQLADHFETKWHLQNFQLEQAKVARETKPPKETRRVSTSLVNVISPQRSSVALDEVKDNNNRSGGDGTTNKPGIIGGKMRIYREGILGVFSGVPRTADFTCKKCGIVNSASRGEIVRSCDEEQSELAQLHCRTRGCGGAWFFCLSCHNTSNKNSRQTRIDGSLCEMVTHLQSREHEWKRLLALGDYETLSHTIKRYQREEDCKKHQLDEDVENDDPASAKRSKN